MSSTELAAFVAKLRAAGTNLPVEALEAGVRASAANVGRDAAIRGRRLNVRVARGANGSTVALSGPGAATAARQVRADLIRRLPEIKRALAADIRAKIRRG